MEAAGQRPAPALEEAVRASAGFEAAMDADLDTPGATAALFSAIRQANGHLDHGDHAAGLALGRVALEGLGALGIEPALAGESPDAAASALAARRDAARAGGDYAASDRLRSELQALGWQVEDTPAGTRLRR